MKNTDPYGYQKYARELVKELLGPKAYPRIMEYDPLILKSLEEFVAKQHSLTYNVCNAFRLRFSGARASDRSEGPMKHLTPMFFKRVQGCLDRLVRRFWCIPSYVEMRRAGVFTKSGAKKAS